MRKLVPFALIAAVMALSLAGGESPAQASHGTFSVHVHDDYYHPAGTFGVPTDHNLAKAACQKASPDAACDSFIHAGDSLSFVAPAPLAANPHSVQECSDGTFTNCSPGADPNNPIGYSGVRNPPSPGPSGWPYNTPAFTTPGTYYFSCDVHPDVMRGRVVVQTAPVGGFSYLIESDSGQLRNPSVESSGGDTSYLAVGAIAAGLVGLALVFGGGLYVSQRVTVRRERDE